MKKSVQWLLVSIVTLAIMFVGATAYASTTTTFQTNGVSATANACLNNCSSTFFLTLQSSKSNGTTSWFVFFDIFSIDNSGNSTFTSGSGQVPASMISGNGNNNLTLNLDTNAAGLQVQSCVSDQFGNFTCSTSPGGIVNVNWQTTSLFNNSITAQNQETFGLFTIHFNMQSDNSSALAQVNAFGTQYTDSGSQLGTAHQGSVSVTKP